MMLRAIADRLGKMNTDIAFRKSAEDRVDECVENDVGIGVTG